jgi:Putative serine esterase (DUF676)
LVARYSIARLYRPCTGNICGLEPINFIAVATPHLGSRGNKQVSFSFPSIFFYKNKEGQFDRLVYNQSGIGDGLTLFFFW